MRAARQVAFTSDEGVGLCGFKADDVQQARAQFGQARTGFRADGEGIVIYNRVGMACQIHFVAQGEEGYACINAFVQLRLTVRRPHDFVR